MAVSDREHFLQYREQTRIKHEIVSKYLPAYFHILKGAHQNLLYIDAFAGRGSYLDEDTGVEMPGSPLRALEAVKSNDALCQRVRTVFIEADATNFACLQEVISKYAEDHPQLHEPAVVQGNFADVLTAELHELEQRGKRIAPAFLFVDPCGVEGVSFATIKRFMDGPSCECFIFFNLDGVRRVAGLEAMSPSLIELFGSEERANAVVQEFRHSMDSYGREQIITSQYDNAIRQEVGTDLVSMFRVESEHRRTTSHYLIHITKHPLGFKIMKDIMWKLGETSEGVGGLSLIQASRSSTGILIRPDWDKFKNTIVEALRNGPVKVESIYGDWVMRPDDRYSEPAYRQALLELEGDQRICVLAPNRTTLMPAGIRRKRNGQPTLGKYYWVAAV